VQGSGADIWNTTDDFRFAYRSLSGDGEIVARVTSVGNTDTWAKAGVMIRETLTPDSPHAMVVVTSGNGVAFQSRTTAGASSLHTSGANAVAPYWVKLVRVGSTLSGYQSADGTNWTLIGSQTIDLGQNVFIGLAVTAHNNSALNASTFTDVSVTATGGTLPADWSTGDIGNVGQPGSASLSNGTWTVQGSGADIWNTTDGFRFAYRSLSGDGEIVARVTSVGNTDGWAKAGVMIRESLTADSPHAMVVVTSGNGVAFQRRTTAGASSLHTSGTNAAAPYWVKLVRTGSTVTGYQSADGVNWTLIGSETIDFGQNIFIGLAVTAHNNAALNTSTFTDVSVTTGGTASGLTGEYFDNRDFTNLVTTRRDATVNFDWGSGTPSGTALTSPDTFSVRWTGRVLAPVTGSYTFTTTSDDGVRLWVNNQLIINNFTDHGATDNNGVINLTAGVHYDIQMEFYENGGLAVAQLSWSYPGRSRQIIPPANLSSNVFAAGNNMFDARDTIVKKRFGDFDYRKIFNSTVAFETNDADGKSIVFTSATFAPLDIGAKFTDNFVPIINWENARWMMRK
jgi:hypothetical protein